MKKRLKIFNTRSCSAGFTLIELLVAMSITIIVVSLAGFGLVTIMQKNSQAGAETERRVNLNRALDFIADEVRMASYVNDNSGLPPIPSVWAWTDLGGGTPKLYLKIPYKAVDSMTNAGSITVNNHGLNNGNAVMFTGSGTISTGLLKDQKYYVIDATKNTFNVSLTLNGPAIPLTSASSGSLTVNKLIIYYTVNSTSTWLGPKTINRSAGDCSTSSNCDVLIDSIAANGFTATAPSSRQAVLNLLGQISANSTETYPVSTSVFARSATPPPPPRHQLQHLHLRHSVHLQ